MTDLEKPTPTGLGDYWSCLNNGEPFAVAEFLERMDDYEVIGPSVKVSPANGDDSAVRMVLWNRLVDAVIWLAPVSDGFELVSHYPAVISGCGEVDATVVSSTDWGTYIEGQVEVVARGQQFTYFDTMFPLSRDSYEPEMIVRVNLSALAIAVRGMSEVAEYAAGSETMTATLSHVYETGETWFGHTNNATHPKDLCIIFGQLTEVEQGAFGSLTLYRARINLFPDVSIPVVFGQTSLGEEGWTPEAGSWVSMMAFMHGYKTEDRPVPRATDQP